MHTRRQFLVQSTALATGMYLGGLPLLAADQSATCQPGSAWGDLPEGIVPGADPNKRRYKILEIHFSGGLSPWETFYVRPNLQWRGFEDKIKRANWDKSGVNDLCGFVPGDPLLTKLFDNTDSDHPIHLGPATSPLWTEKILNRMRVVVQQHDLKPHQAAVPYTATGLRLGRPQMAGMGAILQKRRNALDATCPENQRRKAPTSFVLVPENASADNLEAFWSTGQLGSEGRPVVLTIGGANQLLDRLERPDAQFDPGSTEKVDLLLATYRDAYKGLLTPIKPFRSNAFSGYETALRLLSNVDSLKEILSPDATGPFKDLFEDIRDPRCVAIPPDTIGDAVLNRPRMALIVAAALLQQPRNADYVCVIDNGWQEVGDGTGYDTHGIMHVEHTFANLYNTLATLRQLCDTGLIDLDDTLILLNTEFGRTPDPGGDGRDHWPEGYVSAMIGGPIVPIEASGGNKPRVLGRIGDVGGHAEDFLNATDLRAAAVLAAGITPFARDYLNQGDLSGRVHVSGDERIDTLKRVRSTFFGVT